MWTRLLDKLHEVFVAMLHGIYVKVFFGEGGLEYVQYMGVGLLDNNGIHILLFLAVPKKGEAGALGRGSRKGMA